MPGWAQPPPCCGQRYPLVSVLHQHRGCGAVRGDRERLGHGAELGAVVPVPSQCSFLHNPTHTVYRVNAPCNDEKPNASPCQGPLQHGGGIPPCHTPGTILRAARTALAEPVSYALSTPPTPRTLFETRAKPGSYVNGLNTISVLC